MAFVNKKDKLTDLRQFGVGLTEPRAGYLKLLRGKTFDFIGGSASLILGFFDNKAAGAFKKETRERVKTEAVLDEDGVEVTPAEMEEFEVTLNETVEKALFEMAVTVPLSSLAELDLKALMSEDMTVVNLMKRLLYTALAENEMLADFESDEK